MGCFSHDLDSRKVRGSFEIRGNFEIRLRNNAGRSLDMVLR